VVFTFFPSLYSRVSPSLFLSSSLGHDIDRTTDAKGQQEEKREERRLRPEHINEMGENESNTTGFFWKQTPLRTSSQLPLEHPSPKADFRGKILSLWVSRADRGSACTKRRRRMSRDIPAKVEMKKINGSHQALSRSDIRTLNDTFIQSLSRIDKRK